MTEPEVLRSAAERVEELLENLASLPDSRAAEWGEELVGHLTELYGTAMKRVLAAACAEGSPRGRELMDRLAEDELVASIFLVHDLHPRGLRARVEKAVEELRRSLPGADVRLVELDEEAATVSLRVVASGTDPAAGAVAERRVREAVDAVAPELSKVTVDRLLPATPVHFRRGPPDRQPSPAPAAGERCELCSTEIGSGHGHLVDIESRRLMCTCRACTLLFDREESTTGHFRAVPRDVFALGEEAITTAQWESLQIPVGVAFVFRSSVTGETSAFYPGPAGATESLLPLGAFDEMAAGHPRLQQMRADVEALLVRRGRLACEAYVVPIDRCYELSGLLRRSWRGFDGGAEAHAALDRFFSELGGAARPAHEVASHG